MAFKSENTEQEEEKGRRRNNISNYFINSLITLIIYQFIC